MPCHCLHQRTENKEERQNNKKHNGHDKKQSLHCVSSIQRRRNKITRGITDMTKNKTFTTYPVSSYAVSWGSAGYCEGKPFLIREKKKPDTVIM